MGDTDGETAGTLLMPNRPVSKRGPRPAALGALLALAFAWPALGQTQTRPPPDQRDREGVDAGAVVGTVLDVARRAEEARRKREAERREARERERELERQEAERQREDQAAADRAAAAAQAEMRAREAARADAEREEAARASARRAREQQATAQRAADRARAAEEARKSSRRAAEPAAAPRTPSPPAPEPAPAAPAATATPSPPRPQIPPSPPPPRPAPDPDPDNEGSPLRLPFILLGIAVALLVAGVAVSRVVIAVFGPKPRAVARIDAGTVSAPDFGGEDADLPAPTARAVPGDFTSEIDYPAPAAEAP